MADVWISCECGDPDCPGYRLDDLGMHPFFVPFDKSRFRKEVEAKRKPSHTSVPFGVASTSSWNFDGERTDLNDLFAVLWGLYLRCAGIANVAFLSERGFALETEISSRAVIPVDWGRSYDTWDAEAQKLLLAKTSVHMHRFIHNLFYEMSECAELAQREPFVAPPWLTSVRELFLLGNRDTFELQTRQVPQWTCLTVIDQGLTIAELSETSTAQLKSLLGGKTMRTFESEQRLSLQDDQLSNSVDLSVVRKVRDVLRCVDQEKTETPFLVPMASHLVGIGRRSLVSIAAECGRAVFNDEQMKVIERRRREAEFFMSDVRCIWNDDLPDERFEELIGELLKAERGVVRVRQVGSTREADDGRDYIAEWIAPHVSSLLDTDIKISEDMLSKTVDVVIQVKIRGKGVSRSDAPGLRDTIEHHDCSGMLFVAFPNVTTTLNDHLKKLRAQGKWWIDWWNKADIEDRLRRNTDIAKRYEDLVMLKR